MLHIHELLVNVADFANQESEKFPNLNITYNPFEWVPRNGWTLRNVPQEQEDEIIHEFLEDIHLYGFKWYSRKYPMMNENTADEWRDYEEYAGMWEKVLFNEWKLDTVFVDFA